MIIIILTCQELLAYIVAYFIINIIYRELLVRRSECQEETDGNCRQVTMSLMLAERLIFLVYETGLLELYLSCYHN